METKSFKPYFIVIGLMAVTSLLLAYSVDVQMTDEAGIRVILPDRVGEWRGQEVLYCQNRACQKEYHGGEVSSSNPCPACGSTLGAMTIAEKDLLPADTILIRKQYTHPSGERLFATIVLSGKERVSIHRPQLCLVGQGNEIVRSEVLPVPLENRKPLEVMVLDLIRRVKKPDGNPFEYSSYYAYWFVGKGRETPYHLQRMIWMATDRIFHNVAHRWAYISVSGSRQADSEEYRKKIVSFIHDLYPQLMINQG